VRIERLGLLVHISVLSDDAHVMDEVAEAANRGCLFVLSLAGHQSSATLYILHGEAEGNVLDKFLLFGRFAVLML